MNARRRVHRQLHEIVIDVDQQIYWKPFWRLRRWDVGTGRNNSWCDLVTQCQNEGLSYMYRITGGCDHNPEWKIYIQFNIFLLFFLLLLAMGNCRWERRWISNGAEIAQMAWPGLAGIAVRCTIPRKRRSGATKPFSYIMERIFPILNTKIMKDFVFVFTLQVSIVYVLCSFIWYRMDCWREFVLTLNEMVNLLTYIFWLKFNVV